MCFLAERHHKTSPIFSIIFPHIELIFHSRKQGGVRSIIVSLTCILVIESLAEPYTYIKYYIKYYWKVKLSYTLFCRKLWQTSWIFQSPLLIFAIDFGLNSESKLHTFSYFMAEFVILNKVNNKIRIRVNNLIQPRLLSWMIFLVWGLFSSKWLLGT